MSDDFLRDFEGELHAAARRRRARPARLGAAALVLAVLAIGVGIGVAGTASDPEREAPVPAGERDEGWTEYVPLDCTSTILWEAAPALALPPGPDPPQALAESLRAGLDAQIARGFARRALGKDGYGYWVVPWLRCEDPDAEADRACMVPLPEGAEGVAPQVCATALEIREGGAWIAFSRRDGHSAIAGLAPPGAHTARVSREGREIVPVPVREGAFAGVLEEVDGEVPPYDVSFEGVVSDTRAVAVFGADAAGVAQLLRDEGFGGAREAEGPAGASQPGARVYFTGNEAVREMAAQILDALGLKGDPLPAPDTVRDAAPDAVVWVVLGSS